MRKFIYIILISLLSSITNRVISNDLIPSGYVNDFANVIDDNLESTIERKLSEYNDSTSIEITVVSINSLGGKSVEDYSQELFEKWGIGKKETNSGLLILFSVSDRKWRIHTGYGLEPYLTDNECKKIGKRTLPSFFKNGEYGEGISLCVNEITNELGYYSWDLREQYLMEEREAFKRNVNNFLMWVLNFIVGIIGIFGIFKIFHIINNIIIRNGKIRDDFNNHKRNILKIKEEVFDYSLKLSEMKDGLSLNDSSYLPNRNDLINELGKVNFNCSIFELSPYKFFDKKTNLGLIENELIDYRSKFDYWKRLYSENEKSISLLLDISRHKNILNRTSDFMNKSKLYDMIMNIEEQVDIEGVKFTLDNIKKNNNFLIISLKNFNDTFSLNKEVINNYNKISQRKDKVSSFEGINKDYLLSLLSDIEKKFSCESIGITDLDRSNNYLKIKISEFDKIFDINSSVIKLYSSKEDIRRKFTKTYGDILRSYNKINKEYPFMVNRYLNDFRVDRIYYSERYLGNIIKLIDLSYDSLVKKDFNHSMLLRNNCGDTKNSFESNLRRLSEFELSLKNSEKEISKYIFELSDKSGSLYNRTYSVIKKSDVSKSTIKSWNDIQTSLSDYIKNVGKSKDLFISVKNGTSLYNTLLSIKSKSESDIKDADRRRREEEEAERRRKKRKREEEEDRRRRNSSYGSYGSGSYGGGSSFGGFGGGSSGGGGASGGW